MHVRNEPEIKTKRVNGRGGAPPLMHRPYPVEKEEIVPTRLADHTTAAARAPVSSCAKTALDKVRVGCC